MDPLAVDVRIFLSLTLVLAINVFQIVLVENMPETGKPTDLHSFTFCNTVLLALIALQSIIVCKACKQEHERRKLTKALRDVINKPEVQPKIVKLQRFIRRLVMARKLAAHRRRKNSKTSTLLRRGRKIGKRSPMDETAAEVASLDEVTIDAAAAFRETAAREPSAQRTRTGLAATGEPLPPLKPGRRTESFQAQSVVLQFDAAEQMYAKSFAESTRTCHYRARQRYARFCRAVSSATSRHGDWVSAWILFPIPFALYTTSFAAGHGVFFAHS